MKNSTHKNIRKILSVVLCLCLVMSYVPLMSLTALGADVVTYINENGNSTTYTGAYTEVTSGLTTWSDGWYVVKGDVTVAERITVSGTVNLILADGAQLTANEGICVNQGNTFIVYAQSEDKATMGKLTSTGIDYNAGIGGNKGNDNGTVIINGGIINITGGKFAAGIGGGQAGHGGIVTINGGILTVNAGRFGAAIGGGECGYKNNGKMSSGDGGNVTINGGEVYANGASRAAAIGGGSGDNRVESYAGSGGKLTINDGYVVVKAGDNYSVGIGGGYGFGTAYGHGGEVTINGGMLLIYKGKYSSASIGSASAGDPGTLSINGGLVFYDNKCNLYSDSFDLTKDLKLEKGQTMTLNEGQTLRVNEGVTIINHGNVVNNGTILNLGVIEDVNKNITGGVVTGLNGVFYTEHPYKNGACTLCGATCTSHVFENGFCAHGCAGIYEAATETNDKYYVDGDKNPDQVYEIANAGQLYWFAGLVNGTLADVQQNEKANAILTADIVVNKNVVDNQGNLIGDGSDFLTWTPIGVDNINIFQGNFNGNGHTVSGLYFNDPKDDCVGLIGAGKSCTIKNVGVVNSYFGAVDDIGAILGFNYRKVTILNCFNLNTTIIKHATTTDGVGGITGYVSSYSSVNNCFSTGKVNNAITGAIPVSKVYDSKNNYYLDTSSKKGTFYGDSYNNFATTPTTSEKFASGEIAYLLNNSSPDGIWRQTIGEDAYPNFSGEKVYYGYSCKTEEFLGYTNELAHPTQPHYDENGYCAVCKKNEPAALNENGFYEIYNEGQLFWFADKVNNLNNDFNASYNAILMNDIVINENLVDENGNLTGNTENLRKFRPISDGSHTTFNGIFDGNFHTVSGIYIDDTSIEYGAFFGSIKNGIVKNLGITDSYINSENSAPFAGWSNGTIENCFVTDTVIKGTKADFFTVSNNGSFDEYDYPCMIKKSFSTATVYRNGAQLDSPYLSEYTSENSYCLSATDNGTCGKTQEQFENGEVAFLMGAPWGQEIEKDLHPVWNGKTVYKGYDCGGTDEYYSNTELLQGNDNNHIHSEWVHSDTYGKHQRYVCTREGCPQYLELEIVDCYGGTATCQGAAICSVCYYWYGDYDYNNHTSKKTYMTEGDENGHQLFHECCDTLISTTPHTYDGYDFDTYHHWHACECGYVEETLKESHTFDDNGFCTVCGGYEPAPVVFNEESYSYVAEISNAGQLFWYAENWSACPVYDEEYDEYYETSAGAVLVDDIDLNPGYTFDEDGSYTVDETATNYSPTLREWKPIQGFAWVDFDGQNHTVRGLYVNTPNEDYVAMFAMNDYYTIKNLTLKNGFVYGGFASAAVVANNTGSVLNCHSDLTIKGEGTLGGIVAFHSGSEVSHCSNSGSVIIYGDSSATGGIVGSIYGGPTIDNCFNTGYIKGGINVGGIVGDGEGTTISNCYNTGLILSSYADAHGISKRATLENCYTLGNEDNGAERKTKAQFQNGEVAYLLQANQPVSEIYDDDWNVIGEEQLQVWGQDSNQNGALPIFDSTGLYKVVKIGETGSYSVANIGDTNYDETVDVLDYQALINTILAEDHEQIETASYDDIIRYDVVGDGYLDAIDATVMEKLVNGHKTVDVYAVGDVDHNSKAFEEVDLKVIKHAISNPTKLSTSGKYACDFNRDGMVDANDLTGLIGMYGAINSEDHIYAGKKCIICGVAV